jgi:hypothetical protein
LFIFLCRENGVARFSDFRFARRRFPQRLNLAGDPFGGLADNLNLADFVFQPQILLLRFAFLCGFGGAILFPFYEVGTEAHILRKTTDFSRYASPQTFLFCPLSRTRPEVGCRISSGMRIMVVLPAPFGPSSLYTPLSMQSEMPFRTSFSFWDFSLDIHQNYISKGLLNEMIEVKEEIKMANEILSNISKDKIERAHYLSRKKFLMDMEHSQSAARKDGLEKGRAEVAKNALSMRLPIEQIEQLTGLSRAEIERLQCGARKVGGSARGNE